MSKPIMFETPSAFRRVETQKNRDVSQNSFAARQQDHLALVSEIFKGSVMHGTSSFPANFSPPPGVPERLLKYIDPNYVSPLRSPTPISPKDTTPEKQMNPIRVLLAKRRVNLSELPPRQPSQKEG